MQYKTLPRWGGQGKNSMQYKNLPRWGGQVNKKKKNKKKKGGVLIGTFTKIAITSVLIGQSTCLWKFEIVLF